MKVTETTIKNGRLHTKAVKVEYKKEEVLPLAQKRKLDIRKAIDEQVGDVYDLLADTNKRLGMLERFCMRLFAKLFANRAMDPVKEAEYIAMMMAYLDAVDAGVAIDSADLEDNNLLFQKLMDRVTQIAGIVQNV